MNHLNTEEQARVLKHPDDFSESTRDDVADQQVESAGESQPGTGKTFQVREVAQRLSHFVQRALAGETLTITVRGEPAAQLGPIQHPAITVGEEND